MSPYILRFSVAYIVATIFCGVLITILKLTKGGGAIFLATALAASFYAASAFARDHERAPTAAEKTTFAWHATLAMWAISLVGTLLLVGAVAPGAIKMALRAFFESAIAAAFGIAIFLFLSAIHFVVIRLGFGSYATASAGKERRASSPARRGA
jgi:hypothetical protein